MDCHINITVIPENQVPIDLPMDFHLNTFENGHIQQHLIEKKEDWGRLEFQHIGFEGVCILKSELNLTCSCKIDVRCPYFCWITNFVLEGSLQSTVAHLPEVLSTAAGQYHAFCCNTFQAIIPIKKSVKLFSVYLDHHFIKGLAGTLKACEKTSAPSPAARVLDKEPTTAKLRSIIHDIFWANQADHIRKIYLQSKVLELLSIQLDIREKKTTVSIPPLPDKDIRKLHYAKSLVELNLRNPYSLKMLSNKSGLNEFKLKKGFKQLFGYTVFGYLNDLRMEKGKELLAEGRSVNETADAMGYKNAHHFTAAFKKKWGVLPSKIRS